MLWKRKSNTSNAIVRLVKDGEDNIVLRWMWLPW